MKPPPLPPPPPRPPSLAARDRDHAALADAHAALQATQAALAREHAALREAHAATTRENAELDQQLALLVRAEHRLTRAQHDADQQLARVRALSAFALAYSSDELPADVAGRAARLLREWFALDRVVVVEQDGARGAGLRAEDRPWVAAPAELVARCVAAAPAPWVAQASDTPWLPALIAAVDGGAPPPDDTAVAGIPLGAGHDVIGLVCWRRPNPRASFFSEAPDRRHLPVLELRANHLRHALDNARLPRDLRARTHELADNNARLSASLANVDDAHQRLAQASKLEAIGRLAGGVAHDFNNLLTVILANASMVLDDLPAASPMRDDLTPILEAAERARDLTRQLLLFSRKQESRPEELRLDVVIDEFARIGVRLLGEHIRLRIAHDPAVGTVRIDRTQFGQVLMNLATNARDAMPAGGTLSIETRRATAQDLAGAGCAGDGQRYVAVAISDTGVGMDAHTKEHIFEPFFSTKDSARGTGLGLAIVSSVIADARGHVLVDTWPEQGTCFTLLLPEASQRQPGLPAIGALATILVIEDEDSIRDTLRRILRRRGYHVLEARGGGEALALAAETATIDLVVSDVVMPEQTGPMIVAQLRRARPGLRVLYISGYTFDALRASELRPGERLLPKPFTPEQLVTHVEAALRLPDSA